ncbi:MAG: hypothetical protein QOE55_8097 [Acidobacteriaceae bacterium]|nr:hypothetical protein [Acidobacteriaceae bacterium]
MTARLKGNDVFINCPFDSRYEPIFTAIVFSVYDLGFVARCSLEEDDASEYRLAKIERMIEECRFGINDLSAVELGATTGLPRFNMPFELGLFLGCRRYGPKNQNRKCTLILDTEQYRYREFISDVSGQDIRAHKGDPEKAIREVRDWLQAISRRVGLAGGGEIVEHYRRFRKDLPSICAVLSLEPDKLTFIDLSTTIIDWLKTNR